ncbi:hypothetical protein F5Y10DRAFT_201773 [Nemania abortiva]|nr:hypothetical protein F5Y10DRAFT_201773 [Nemania abortiva]
MSWTRSAHRAKDACTRLRLPAEAAKRAEHAEYHTSPHFFYKRSRPHTFAHVRPDVRPLIFSATRNEKLAKRLAEGRMLYESIENICLPLLTERPHGVSHYDDDRIGADNIALIDEYIRRAEGQTHRIIACQRHYAALIAAQLLLDVVWKTPENPRRVYLLTHLLQVMGTEEKKPGWPGKRTLLRLNIGVARGHVPLQPHPEAPERWAKERLPYIHPSSRHASLDRALDLLLSDDLASAVPRIEAALLFSTKLADGVVVAAKRLGPVDRSIRLIARKIRLASLPEKPAKQYSRTGLQIKSDSHTPEDTNAQVQRILS